MAIALAALLIIQPVTGLFVPGLYRDEGWVAATWFGNDLVTLVLAVPTFLVGLIWLRNGGGGPAWMLFAGALAYALYSGAFYLLGATLNPAFPLYVAITLLAAVTLARLMLSLSPDDLHASFAQGWHRTFSGLALLFAGFGLAAVWLVFWWRAIALGAALPTDEPAFRLVAALDLVLLVPVLLGGGYLLLRRRPWGLALAAMAAVLGVLYQTVLTANSTVLILRGFAEPPGELPIWAPLLALMILTAVFLFRGLQRGKPPT